MTKEYFGWFTRDCYSARAFGAKIITHTIEDTRGYYLIDIIKKDNRFIICLASLLQTQAEDLYDGKVQYSFSSLDEAKTYSEKLLNQLRYKVLDKDMLCFG